MQCNRCGRQISQEENNTLLSCCPRCYAFRYMPNVNESTSAIIVHNQTFFLNTQVHMSCIECHEDFLSDGLARVCPSCSRTIMENPIRLRDAGMYFTGVTVSDGTNGTSGTHRLTCMTTCTSCHSNFTSSISPITGQRQHSMCLSCEAIPSVTCAQCHCTMHPSISCTIEGVILCSSCSSSVIRNEIQPSVLLGNWGNTWGAANPSMAAGLNRMLNQATTELAESVARSRDEGIKKITVDAIREWLIERVTQFSINAYADREATYTITMQQHEIDAIIKEYADAKLKPIKPQKPQELWEGVLLD